jgi:PAS domain S-box-containing protein
VQSQCADGLERVSGLEATQLHILESISAGVINFDRSGRVTYINRAAREIFRVESEEVVGEEARDVFGGEEKFVSLVREALEEQRTRSRVELPVTLGRQRVLWLGISSSLLRDEAGDVDGATFIFTDITEVRQLQEEIATNERLAALGEMSAGIAHELRNSIGAILGFSRLLECQLDAGERSEVDLLKDIVRECRSMEGLLQQFLDFTKPPRLMIERVAVPEVVEDSLRLLEAKIAASGVSLETSYDRALPRIMGDPLLLRQAFSNVVQNAIEATRGGGRLNVSCYQRHETGEVTVRFEDTGVGISRENLERIFNPFFTLKDDGVGLGLSLVHKIISAHGGEVHVESEPEQGTRVVITLPVEEGER